MLTICKEIFCLRKVIGQDPLRQVCDLADRTSYALVIYSSAVGGGRQVRGSEILDDLLEGGQKNFAFLFLKGVEKFHHYFAF